MEMMIMMTVVLVVVVVLNIKSFFLQYDLYNVWKKLLLVSVA